VLAVRDVSVAFDGTTVLDRVSLEIADGEVVALLGPSGSGKSTLLRVVAGLLEADTGTVVLDGADVTSVPTHRRGVGMVFQDEQLFPHRDVAGNVAFGLVVRHVPEAERDARVKSLLELVGLPGFERRRVTDLSGGEAKRVALARSLAPEPRALLLDEPLTGLDRELHDRLAVELARILRRAGTTTVIVTHDRAEAETVADRIVTMTELGPPVVELAAADTYELRAALLRNDTPSASVELDGDDEPTTVHLGVRDRHGRVIATSTWLRRPFPGALGGAGDAVQLRAMATAADVQGTGMGGRVLRAGLARLATDPGTVVWANARDSALDFYRRHGFAVVEPGFLDPATNKPHHVIRWTGAFRSEPPDDTQDS